MKRAFMVVVLIAVSVGAAADTLSDLRKTLERFPAKAPFAARGTVRMNAATEFDPNRGGTSSFYVESGGSGFTVRIAPSTLEAAEREAAQKKRNPNAATPTRTAMVALTIFDIMDALDAASFLIDDLSAASVLEEKSVSYQGKPATLLRVKVKPSLATKSRYVAEPVIELSIWIGGDGVPVAATRVSNFSAGVLFVKAANTRTEHWTFAVAGDRLYAVQNDEDDKATAVGKQIASSRSVSYTTK